MIDSCREIGSADSLRCLLGCPASESQRTHSCKWGAVFWFCLRSRSGLLFLLSGITQNQQCSYPHNIQNTHVTCKKYVGLVAQQINLPQDNNHKQWILFGKFLLFIPVNCSWSLLDTDVPNLRILGVDTGDPRKHRGLFDCMVQSQLWNKQIKSNIGWYYSLWQNKEWPLLWGFLSTISSRMLQQAVLQQRTGARRF